MQHLLDASMPTQNDASSDLPGREFGVRHVDHADTAPVPPRRHEGSQAADLIGGELGMAPASHASL